MKAFATLFAASSLVTGLNLGHLMTKRAQSAREQRSVPVRNYFFDYTDNGLDTAMAGFEPANYARRSPMTTYLYY